MIPFLCAVSLLAQLISGQPVPVISSVPLSAFHLGAGSALKQATDGTQVLVVGYGSTASVDLGVSPAQLQAYPPGQSPYVREGIYTLNFKVVNDLPTYPGGYDIEIDFGTQKLGELYGWGKKSFASMTATFSGPGYIVIDQALPGGGQVQGAKNFVINVTSDPLAGWPVQLKDFSLTFTSVN